MTVQPSPTDFFVTLARTQAVLTRMFDARLGGISLTEFMILRALHNAEQSHLRRTDVAEQVGLTVSGVTRLLLPMEKIGLVRREADPHDARVSYVVLAAGGKRKLEEATERAELLAEEILPEFFSEHVRSVTSALRELTAAVR